MCSLFCQIVLNDHKQWYVFVKWVPQWLKTVPKFVSKNRFQKWLLYLNELVGEQIKFSDLWTMPIYMKFKSVQYILKKSVFGIGISFTVNTEQIEICNKSALNIN